METCEQTKLLHQYGNGIFGARLILKNLQHIINTSMSSEHEKLQCQKLLDMLTVKIDNIQILQKKFSDEPSHVCVVGESK